MHRRYRPWHYAEKLRLIRQSMPDAAIGADVMVGFPGESEALFEESFAFIAAQPFTYLHLFPFSARPETRAWQLAQEFPVPPQAVARAHGTAACTGWAPKIFASGRAFWAASCRRLPCTPRPAKPLRHWPTTFLKCGSKPGSKTDSRPTAVYVLLVTGLTETGLTGQLAP